MPHLCWMSGAWIVLAPCLERGVLGLAQLLDLLVAKTAVHMIINHAGGLHMGIADRGADKLEAALF